MAVVTLRTLLDGIADVADSANCPVIGLSDDSRQLSSGQVFVAYPGIRSDGRHYIDAAIAAGAAAVLYDKCADAVSPADNTVPMVAIENLKARVGHIAARFFRHPSQDMNVYAVTGTNGKTSVSHFLARALNDERAVGVMGTLGNGLWGHLAASPLTTPSALSLQKMLMQMRADGVTDVVMEASSHGLDQNRLAATQIDTAIFTNLSQDHLDYHQTMEKYATAKRRLFEVDGLKYAVINVYDEFGAQLANTLPANIELVSYGLKWGGMDKSVMTPMIQGELRQSGLAGVEIDINSPYGSATLVSTVLGRFNAENLLAVLAAMLANKINFDYAVKRLSQAQAVVGRMERFGGLNQPQVFVDYAHTPAALQTALADLKQCCFAKLHVVFGCGGERDTDKRAQMGAIAQRYADMVVITDDNPRNEPPQQIIDSILLGANDSGKVHVERDRAKAILFCLERANKDDVVLIAGKGHEDYQLIEGRRVVFSDRDFVRKFLAQAA